jgi:hypothetical protein
MHFKYVVCYSCLYIFLQIPLHLQMVKRERMAKLPLQANVYPMPSGAFIEDSKTRVTLLSAQSAGVASHSEGLI